MEKQNGNKRIKGIVKLSSWKKKMATISDIASNILGLLVEWPWSITSEVSDAIIQLGGVWGVHCEHPQWGPGMKPLEALTYLCFPDPEMANYETLKQVVCSWKIQCTPSKTSAEAAILSVDNIIVYFTESKSHIWRFCITQVGLEKHVRSVFLSFLIQSIGH